MFVLSYIKKISLNKNDNNRCVSKWTHETKVDTLTQTHELAETGCYTLYIIQFLHFASKNFIVSKKK